MGHDARTRLISATVIAVVFSAGLLVGFAVDGTLDAESPEMVTETPTEESGDEGERRGPVYAQLEPTVAEQALIDSIVAVHRERTNALDKETRRVYRQEFRTILLETREAIKGVLSAEDAAEYQRLLDEHDARREAERSREDDD